jgi:hypothetical protein
MDFSRQNIEGPLSVGIGGYAWAKLKSNTNVQNFVSKLGGKTNTGIALIALGVLLKAYKPDSEAMNVIGYLLAGMGAGALGDDMPATGTQAQFTNQAPQYTNPLPQGVNYL